MRQLVSASLIDHSFLKKTSHLSSVKGKNAYINLFIFEMKISKNQNKTKQNILIISNVCLCFFLHISFQQRSTVHSRKKKSRKVHIKHHVTLNQVSLNQTILLIHRLGNVDVLILSQKAISSAISHCFLGSPPKS